VKGSEVKCCWHVVYILSLIVQIIKRSSREKVATGRT
jgi:hypothetical protein